MATPEPAPPRSSSSSAWPDPSVMERLKKKVKDMAGIPIDDVRVVVSPYRICPLGAHIDHQGGSVTAMAIDKGVLLAFAPSHDHNDDLNLERVQPTRKEAVFLGENIRLSKFARMEVMLCSSEFGGTVQFSMDKIPPGRLSSALPALAEFPEHSATEECGWGDYARGAAAALQKKGCQGLKGIFGFLEGSRGFDGGGLSSSAAQWTSNEVYYSELSLSAGSPEEAWIRTCVQVGVAFLLALEHVNDLCISEVENIELHRFVENEYLGLQSGVLDQSAILLSKRHCLSLIHCKDLDYEIVVPPRYQKNTPLQKEGKDYKIMIAFSGLRAALAHSPGYNMRVSECRNAARKLLRSVGRQSSEPLLCNVTAEEYMEHKGVLQGVLVRRAEHFFSESARVQAGVDAWSSGDLVKFGNLMSESGQSSVENYECGCEPLVQLWEILLDAPGILGARFSGAGFRGCCVAFVAVDQAEQAVAYVEHLYRKAQPELVLNIVHTPVAILCDSTNKAHVL